MLLSLALMLCGTDNPTELLASKDQFLKPRIGQVVPKDLVFTDEEGKSVTLDQYGGDRPVILVLAYYKCPQLCTLVLNDLVKGLRGVGLFDIGRNLDVVVVSFDPSEKPELAAAKKAAYVEEYGRPGAEKGFHFLTGSQESINQLQEATGFRAVYDPQRKEYAHVRAIMIASPTWKLTHYFTDGAFAPLYLSQALTQATTGKTGSFISNFMQMCFVYDPVTSRYSINVMIAVRIGAIITIVTMLGLWLGFWWRARREPAAAA
ncbi:MAG: SCO family protein [Planctomycetia bacterium]|nr:SCO family protein [Planctomycetia bacterium]